MLGHANGALVVQLNMRIWRMQHRFAADEPIVIAKLWIAFGRFLIVFNMAIHHYALRTSEVQMHTRLLSPGGFPINHQWGKSSEAEQLLHDYIRHALVKRSREL